MDILFRQTRLRFSRSGQEKQESSSNTSESISYKKTNSSFNQGDEEYSFRRGQEAKDGEQSDSNLVTAIAAAAFAISLRDDNEPSTTSNMESGNNARIRQPFSRSLSKQVLKKGTNDAGEISTLNAKEYNASPASKPARSSFVKASSFAVGYKKQAENLPDLKKKEKPKKRVSWNI